MRSKLDQNSSDTLIPVKSLNRSSSHTHHNNQCRTTKNYKQEYTSTYHLKTDECYRYFPPTTTTNTQQQQQQQIIKRNIYQHITPKDWRMLPLLSSSFLSTLTVHTYPGHEAIQTSYKTQPSANQAANTPSVTQRM